jgi:hypothetical protein
MAWRVAEALLTLRSEIDKLYPDRNKASDGTIGNAAHATRVSDHNPWVKDGNVGVVTAMDITNDPTHGPYLPDLAFMLRNMGKSGDKRVKYVIFNRRIASSVADWKWRAYTGPNAHTHHLHLSVSFDREFYDSRARWFPEMVPVKPAEVDDPEMVDMIIGKFKPDGRLFVINGDVKRQISRAEADELKLFGVPEREVSSTLLNRFPTALPPSGAAAL